MATILASTNSWVIKHPYTAFQGVNVGASILTVVSQVSTHAGQNSKLCLSAHGHLPGALWYNSRVLKNQSSNQLFSDGQDFDGPSSVILNFPPGSSPGDLQCVTINLMHDNIAEGTENLIVELHNNDSAVIVPAGGDIVIINIWDMPNPFGK